MHPLHFESHKLTHSYIFTFSSEIVKNDWSGYISVLAIARKEALSIVVFHKPILCVMATI